MKNSFVLNFELYSNNGKVEFVSETRQWLLFGSVYDPDPRVKISTKNFKKIQDSDPHQNQMDPKQ